MARPTRRRDSAAEQPAAPPAPAEQPEATPEQLEDTAEQLDPRDCDFERYVADLHVAREHGGPRPQMHLRADVLAARAAAQTSSDQQPESEA